MDTGGGEQDETGQAFQSQDATGAGPAARAAGMNDRPPPDLRAALRAARIDDAERSRAIADLRGAEIARLDLLREAIEPVLAAVPDVEMFDAGLIPVPRPRLFIDMIAFVEMAHDRRRYRFVQETRQGRVVLAESEQVETIREAITRYVARRLVEREKALAIAPVVLPAQEPCRQPRPYHLHRPDRHDLLRQAGVLILDNLGVAALCVLLWVIGHALFQAWMGAPHP
jgi:hypothetical protein